MIRLFRLGAAVIGSRRLIAAILVVLLCFSFVLCLTCESEIALARQRSPAARLAERFMSFCLDQRLDVAHVTRQAEQLGLIAERIESLDADFKVWHWRDLKMYGQFAYSLTSSEEPGRNVSILVCSVTGGARSLAAVERVLVQSAIIGRKEQFSDESMASKHVAWFFVRNEEPYWLNLVRNPFASSDSVIISLATHQRLKP